MLAAVLRTPHSELVLEERERPRPERGQVLVRVHACGVCHSDVALQEGYYAFASFPRVPGHEITGTIEELGEGVEWPPVGAKVGVPWLHSSCRHCRECVRGDEILCTAGQQITGVTVDGGYQEYMVAPAEYVAPLPDQLDLVAAAPLLCAGITVFNALRLAELQPGQRVAIVGFGGLGQLGVQYAHAMGARVAVVSSSPEKADRAALAGAELFLTPEDVPSGQMLAEWDGGADVILTTPPTLSPANDAFTGLAPDGTMVVLGVGPGQLQIEPLDLIMPRRRIIGSPSGSRHELRDALQFAAQHGITPQCTTYPLDAVADAVADTRDGTLSSRAVLTLG